MGGGGGTKQEGGKVCTRGGVGGGEGVRGDKSGDGGTCGGSRGVYLHTLNVLHC